EHRLTRERRRADRNKISPVVRHKTRETVVALLPCRHRIIPEPDIDRESRSDAPVVLHVPTEVKPFQAEELCDVEPRADRAAEEKIGKAKAAVHPAEAELAGRRAGRMESKTAGHVVETEFQLMPP